MSFTLGPKATSWNDAAKSAPDALYLIRADLYNRLHSNLLSETDASELRVLTAIVARTLKYKKFAEAISGDVFIHGLTGAFCGDGLSLDESGKPHFTGCGISKDETVYSAVKRLEEKGLITVFRPVKKRFSNVYMPFSEDWLAERCVKHGCQIPTHYERWMIGERVMWGELLVEITSMGQNGDLGVVPLDRYLRQRDREHWIESSKLRRISTTELEEAKLSPVALRLAEA